MPSVQLDDLVGEARAAALTPDDARRAIGLLDLTSLKGDESEAEIVALCATACHRAVAAVCVYPSDLSIAKPLLAGSGVKLAAVANFPDGSDDILRAVDEVADAVSLGADEIDLVAPLQSIMEDDFGMVSEMVTACRRKAGPSIKLKLILETGLLQTPDRITAAARNAVMAGIDTLKTSTGKIETGATLDAAIALLAVIQESNGRVGLKIAGGVRTAGDAAGYLHLAARMMGDDWITPENMRFGASSLLDDLLRVAVNE